MFWDGRAASLEEQALGPLLSSEEMGMEPPLVLERLKADSAYKSLFSEAFSSEATLPALAQALAAFQRTLVCASSPFDQFEWEGKRDALSAGAQRGLVLFRGRGRCSTCHVGSNFSDENFHNIGIGFSETSIDDGQFAATKNLADRGKFKTPSLRNVERTAPYMHNGGFTNLFEVIDFYDRGGISNPNLDREIHPLNLSPQDKIDLVEFLKALSGPIISVYASALNEESE